VDRLLENDTILKILSLVVGLILWVGVMSTNSQAAADRPFGPIPLEYQPPSKSSLTVMSLNPNTVTVELRGSVQKINGTSPHSIAAFVDMQGLTHSGTYTLPVRVSVPTGTSFVSVVPSKVTVVIDRLGSRRMNLDLAPSGSPAPGYELKSLTANTKTATLSGPTSELNKVRKVVAEVPVGGRNASFQEQVVLLPLNADDRTVQKVQVSPAMVSASATIKKRPPQKSAGVVAKLTGHPAAGYTVTNIVVRPATVTITGSQSAISPVNVIYTVPINVSGDTGSVSAAVPLVFPSGVSGLRKQDVSVSVTIAKTG
jgi:YbbR domain-containing protein